MLIIRRAFGPGRVRASISGVLVVVSFAVTPATTSTPPVGLPLAEGGETPADLPVHPGLQRVVAQRLWAVGPKVGGAPGPSSSPHGHQPVPLPEATGCLPAGPLSGSPSRAGGEPCRAAVHC